MKNFNEKILSSGIHHVAIKVKNFDDTIKFYTEGLGLEKSLCWGDSGNRVCFLDAAGGTFIQVFENTSGDEVSNGIYTHLAFYTKDCEAAIKAAKDAGARVKGPIEMKIPSSPDVEMRTAYCKGPNGESIEFFEENAMSK
ncbi:VOC family protein [Clostridium sp.]|jgi:glyoxylase I family protein|uniref:VOC family protein n=1 Tax=Clostridium sp. TaxID=1506 RepID=UPI00258F1B12|nr:VOC family protein [Clostridium sp.]MDF2505755.1 glyoxalase-like protein [Clostridium sp.]